MLYPVRKSTLKSFNSSPYYSIKHSNYFEIYDKLLTKFVDKRITFVEIGILDGGSLFMFRNFLGKRARIIGIDLNPNAKKWEDYGFEVFIGDQSNRNFWKSLFDQIGNIDVLLDDGGHKNDQQILTVSSVLPYINDEGLIIVEDTHTSFVKFESFKKLTFIEFISRKIPSLHARNNELTIKEDSFTKHVSSIEFFTGIVAISVDRKLCGKTFRLDNSKKRNFSIDYRYNLDSKLTNLLRTCYNWISWDYMTENRISKYPWLFKMQSSKFFSLFLKCSIAPTRFLLYTGLKLLNAKNLKKKLRNFEM